MILSEFGCILSYSPVFLWDFLRILSETFGSLIVSDSLGFFWILWNFLWYFQILFDFLGLSWILPNWSGFSQILQDFFGFSHILSVSLVLSCILLNSLRSSTNCVWFSHFLLYSPDSHILSRILLNFLSKLIRFLAYYFRFYRIFSNYFRILSNSIEFFLILPYCLVSCRFLSDFSGFSLVFRILPESYLFYPNLSRFSRILSESFEFSRCDSLTIYTNSLVFSGIPSDSTVVSPILSDFGQILSYSLGLFRILPELNVFSRILSDFSGFSHLLLDSYGLFRILSNSFYAVCILWDSFRFYRSLSYPLGIWPNSRVFFRNLVGFSHIRSYSSWFCRIFTIFFGFWEIFPDSLTFSWTLMVSSKSLGLSRFLQILPRYFFLSCWNFTGFSCILLDTFWSGFFHIILYSFKIFAYSLDFVGFSRIIFEFSKMLKYNNLVCGFSRIVSHYTQLLSDSSVLSPILFIFGRILRHSLGFFRILLDNLRFFWNLGGFSRIHLDSSRFSWNLIGFSYILSYFFEILYICFPKFSDTPSPPTTFFSSFKNCFGFSRILSNFLGLSWIFSNSSDSPKFSRILPFSLTFSRIPSYSSKFSTFFPEFRRILPYSFGFTEILSNSLKFSRVFSSFFEIYWVSFIIFQIL